MSSLFGHVQLETINLKLLTRYLKLIIGLLFLFSCNSPEARLERLQHDFWEKFAKRDFFEIKLQKEVLHLPLPPVTGQSNAQPILASSLQEQANAIDASKLSLENQKQLAQLRAALDDCVAHAGMPFFDPSRCVVAAHLAQLSDHPELSLFLEKIPVYYAQIEDRWQVPDTRFVSKAVDESQAALDLLQGLGIKTDGKMAPQIEAARGRSERFYRPLPKCVIGGGTQIDFA